MRKIPVRSVILMLTCAVGLSVAMADNVDTFLKNIKDPSSEVRAKAINELCAGCAKPARAVPPLIEALKDPEWKVRAAAAEALGYFTQAGNRSIRPLLDNLMDERVEVRRASVLSLGRLGSGVAAVKEALTRLENDADPTIKTNVTIAKGLIGSWDDSVIPSLIQALSSNEDPTSEAAGVALSRLGKQSPEKLIPTLLEVLNKNEQPLTNHILKVLRAMKHQGEGALPSVAAAYERVDSKTRTLVLRTVVEMDSTGEHALPLCMKALGDPDPFIRKDALMGAMRYKTKLEGYLAPIIESLKDSDEENKLMAIAIIRGLGNQAAQAVPSLIALTSETNQRVRISAISTLGLFNPPTEEAFLALTTALSDRDEKVKTVCLNALRTIGQRDPALVVPILEKALESENEQKAKRSIMATLDGLKKTGEGRSVK